MFDSINGARLAYKRLTANYDLSSSNARELAARAAGWRDWHHLEATIATQPAPKGFDARRLADFMTDKGIDLYVDDLLAIINPVQPPLLWESSPEEPALSTRRSRARSHEPMNVFFESALRKAKHRMGRIAHPSIGVFDMESPYVMNVVLENPVDGIFGHVRTVTVDLRHPKAMRRTVAAIVALQGVAERMLDWYDAMTGSNIPETQLPTWMVSAPEGMVHLFPQPARTNVRRWIDDAALHEKATLADYEDGMELNWVGGELSWRSEGDAHGIQIEDGCLIATVPRMEAEDADAMVGLHVTRLQGLDLEYAGIPDRMTIHGWMADAGDPGAPTRFGITTGRWRPISPVPSSHRHVAAFARMPVGMRIDRLMPWTLEEGPTDDAGRDEAARAVLAARIAGEATFGTAPR